jgi:transcriptional repressor NrdR
MNMPCPECKGKTKVIDTRLRDSVVRRRRECLDCQHKFYTTERITKAKKDTPKTKRQKEYEALFAKYR